MSGRLFGVGVGPGDPELLTVKAQRIVAAVDVIAYPNARHGRSVARAIAAPHFRGDQIEVALEYPVTTEQTDTPGRLRGGAERVLRRGRGAAGRPPRRRARRRGPV